MGTSGIAFTAPVKNSPRAVKNARRTNCDRKRDQHDDQTVFNSRGAVLSLEEADEILPKLPHD
jgi:hypothetical protein